MTATEKTGFDLDEFLPYRMNRLSERINRALSGIYGRSYELAIPDWRVLAWLSQHERLTARDICRLALMDKATVSRAVQRLAARGLLRRTPSTLDQRQQWLSLTAPAQALLGELLPATSAWEARLLDALSEAERRQLRLLMGKLERQLDVLQAPSRGQV